MTSIRNGAISMDIIYDAARRNGQPSAMPPATKIQAWTEKNRSGPEHRLTIDLDEECWSRLLGMVAESWLTSDSEYREHSLRGHEWWKECMSGCLPHLQPVDLLGMYHSGSKEISYFSTPRSSIERREIVQIHERMHAIHHLIPDANGSIWEEFSTVQNCAIEFLAQIFTFKYLETQEPSLLREMILMSRGQGLIYRMPVELMERRMLSDDECLRRYWEIRETGRMSGVLGDIFAALGDMLASAGEGLPRDRHAPTNGRSSRPVATDRVFTGGKLSAIPNESWYMLTCDQPQSTDDDVEACLRNGRLQSSRKNLGKLPRLGAFGFLRDHDENIVAIIEIAGDWTPDPGNIGCHHLPFRVVERWNQALPFSVLADFKGRARFARPVYEFKDSADCDIIRAAHVAMVEGGRMVAARLNEAAGATIDEFIRRSTGF